MIATAHYWDCYLLTNRWAAIKSIGMMGGGFKVW
jgi:hypothetical protein